MSVTDWQFELVGTDRSVVFGKDTPYHTYDFAHGKPDETVNDYSMSTEDGIRFGRDHLAGTLAGWDIGVEGTGPADVLDKVRTLRSLWYGTDTRVKPGAVMILRLKRPGSITVRLYGRPRKFDVASMADVASGYVPVVMDFQCVDGYFYSDAEFATTVSIVPPSTTGLVGELIGDIVSEPASQGQGRIVVSGSEPSWLVARPNGPITNPTIEVAGQWSYTLQLSIAYDQSLTVDPTPWTRSVRRSTGANAAGTFTQASQRLSAMRLPVGQQTVMLRGHDPTGTASASLYWRDVWASW